MIIFSSLLPSYSRRLDQHGYAHIKQLSFFGKDGLAGLSAGVRRSAQD